MTIETVYPLTQLQLEIEAKIEQLRRQRDEQRRQAEIAHHNAAVLDECIAELLAELDWLSRT